jgi:hypothetical protein
MKALSIILMSLSLILMACILCVPFCDDFTLLIKFDDVLFIEGMAASILLFFCGAFIENRTIIPANRWEESNKKSGMRSAIYGISLCIALIVFLSLI